MLLRLQRFIDGVSLLLNLTGRFFVRDVTRPRCDWRAAMLACLMLMKFRNVISTMHRQTDRHTDTPIDR